MNTAWAPSAATMRALRLAAALLLLAATPLAALARPALTRASLAAPRRSRLVVASGDPEPARKQSVEEALAAAEERLEAAPSNYKSLGDLGNPVKPVEPPAVPAVLSAAPLVVGAFSVLLFVLNAFGLFGDGPGLDELAREWSQ